MSKSQPITQNSTQTNSIPAWLTNYSKAAGQQGADLPQYTAYTGPGVAGLSPDQMAALGLASGNVGSAGNVLSMGLPSANALTGYNAPQITAGGIGADTQALMNPYIQSVVDATNRGIDQNTQQAINSSDNQFAAQHAFGGDRQGVASGVIRSQGDLQKAQITSQLMSQGYSSAQAAALAEQQANQGAANAAAGIRLGGVNALTGAGSALSGINAQDLAGLLTAGGMQQQIQNAQNQFGYQQYLNQYQIPDTQAQTFASILSGLPHSTSQTGSQTQMSYSNPLMGLAGLGLSLGGMGLPTAAAGTAGFGGALTSGGTLGGAAMAALLPLLSDRKAKTDVAVVGQLFDGTPVYRFRYIKDGPTAPMQIGLMAQDVERTVPDAIQEIEGMKHVDYEKATELAAAMGA